MVLPNLKPRIQLVMPVYNEAKNAASILNLQNAVARIEQEARKHPEYDFKLLIADDNSTDDTSRVALAHVLASTDCYTDNNGLVVRTSLLSPYGAPAAGLARNLQRAYNCIVRDRLNAGGPFYTLKLDADTELDQGEVIRKMLPLVDAGVPIAVGIRAVDISPKDNPLEARLQKYMHNVFEKELGLGELDPSSASVQLYRGEHLRRMLCSRKVSDYPFQWGLDVQFDVMSAAEGVRPVVVKVDDGQYIPARRSEEKVKRRFAAYEWIASQSSGKDPEHLRAQHGFVDGDLPPAQRLNDILAD